MLKVLYVFAFLLGVWAVFDFVTDEGRSENPLSIPDRPAEQMSKTAKAFPLNAAPNFSEKLRGSHG